MAIAKNITKAISGYMLLGHTPERIAEEGRTIDVVKIINVIVE